MVSLSGIFKELKWPSISCCERAFPIFCLSVHTVRWCTLGIELYSVNVNTSIIMAWQKDYLFVYGHKVFSSNCSNWAHNWLCLATVLNAHISMHIGFSPISHDRACHCWTLPEFESCINRPLGIIVIAAIRHHSATHTKTGSIKL